MSQVTYFARRDVERFDGVVDHLRSAVSAMESKVFDRPELNPGYRELLGHLDRALRWADEMQWIIETELAPDVVKAERLAERLTP